MPWYQWVPLRHDDDSDSVRPHVTSSCSSDVTASEVSANDDDALVEGSSRKRSEVCSSVRGGERSRARVRRIHHKRALQDELKRQDKNKHPDQSDVTSVKSSRVRRSRSLGRADDASRATSRDASPRQRSRSGTRRPQPEGYWTAYLPDAPVWTPAPVARTYTRTQPQVVHAPRVYQPVIGPPPLVYVDRPAPAPRVYVPATTTGRVYAAAPSKPKASIYISPRSTSKGGNFRKADVFVVDSGDDQPLRRSDLGAKVRRSSSTSQLRARPVIALTASTARLDDSLARAERSAELLRARTRQMYKGVRDDLYRSQLLADTV